MSFKVSIIVPVYNSSKYLKKCVESLLNQSYKNLEIILVDDGSTDNSRQYIREYMESFPEKVKGVFLENGGVSRARNIGIKEATGKLIAFCDADDYLSKTYIESLANPFNTKKSNRICMTVGNITFVNEGIERVDPISNELKLSSNEVMLDNIVQSNIGGYVWNKMFRKEIINNLNLFFDEKIRMSEDLLFLSEYLYLNKGYETIVVEDTGYYYVNRKGSAMNSGREFTSINVDLKILKYSKGYPKLHKYVLNDYVNKLVQKEFFYESDPTRKKFKNVALKIKKRNAFEFLSKKHKCMLGIGMIFPVIIPLIRKILK